MFVGHLAAGLIGKSIEPKISLGTWVLAVLLCDVILFPLLIVGIETIAVEPGEVANAVTGLNIAYSHSLLMTVVWALIFAVIYFLRKRYARGAALLFAGVLSHWLLDLISHRPDMPLAPGISTVFGLGLWNSIPATLMIEGGFWLLAIVLYVRAIRRKNWLGFYAFWLGAILITLLWLGNINEGMDPDPIKAGIGGMIVFSLMIGWAYWMNRVRADKADLTISPA